MEATTSRRSDSEDDFKGVHSDTSEEFISEGSDEESSDSDGDGDPEDVNLTDGVWMNIMGEDIGPDVLPSIANPGPKHAPLPDSTPYMYVKQFITDNLIDILVTETNRYSRQWIEQNQQYLQDHPHSMVHQWIKQRCISREEMYSFLSIILNMGLPEKKLISVYWDVTHESQSTPWFVKHFKRDRFFLMMKFLHFSNNENAPAEDDPNFKLYKIKPIVDHFLEKFKHFFQPNQDISIDESMVGYKGTPHLRQFMPNKHHARFGIKLWCLCDSKTGYTYSFEVYKGAHDPQDRQAESITYALVMRMMEDSRLLHMGYHLGLDNYFTSPQLLFRLYDSHTSATGTVMKNRKGLPVSVVKAKLGNMLCVAYKDGSRQPILLSTHSKAGYDTARNSKGRERRLPKTIIHYNRSMGGVDLADARLYCYLSERRTMKWTKKVFFSLLSRAVLNAYIIYSVHTSERPVKTRFWFTVSVVESMMGDFRPPQKVTRTRRSREDIAAAQANPQPLIAPTVPASPGPSACKLEKLPVGKRRNSVFRHASRVRMSYQCPSCDVSLCPSCFAGYHHRKSASL